MSKIVIPQRFVREVKTHLYSNALSQVSKETLVVPLILGIHGGSGQGKSFQLNHILNEANYQCYHISGAQLESDRAGEPAKLIKDIYLRASTFNKQEYNGVAIVIDDIDAGLGNWGELYQYTVNTQIVFALLMHLADNPYKIDNTTVKRTPIFITGNDFSKLYKPLTRSGRMKSFTWNPNNQELRDLLKPVYPLLSEEELVALINYYPSQPLVFFTDLKQSIISNKIFSYVEDMGEAGFYEQLKTGYFSGITPSISLEDLLDAAKEITINTNHENHLN